MRARSSTASSQLVDAAVVVSLGNVATRVLLGTDEGITTLRGRTHAYRGGVLVPTFHPAYALRGGGGSSTQMRADLVRASSRSRRAMTRAAGSRCRSRSDGEGGGAASRLARRPRQALVVLTGGLGAGKTTSSRPTPRRSACTSHGHLAVVHARAHSRALPERPVAVLAPRRPGRLHDARRAGGPRARRGVDDGAAALVEWGERFDVPRAGRSGRRLLRGHRRARADADRGPRGAPRCPTTPSSWSRSMRLLAIETATAVTGSPRWPRTRRPSSGSSTTARRHTEVLAPAIVELLAARMAPSGPRRHRRRRRPGLFPACAWASPLPRG